MNQKDTTLLFVLWIAALGATLGALFIGEVMGRVPCNLCWYQRICMFPLVVILGLGLWRSDRMAWLYALPLVIVGALFAAYHSLLYAGIIPAPLVPCTGDNSCTSSAMLLGGVPLPWLSLGIFVFILGGLIKLSRSNPS